MKVHRFTVREVRRATVYVTAETAKEAAELCLDVVSHDPHNLFKYSRQREDCERAAIQGHLELQPTTDEMFLGVEGGHLVYGSDDEHTFKVVGQLRDQVLS